MSRPPKPTHLKLVEGNPGKRPINAQEPDPAYLNDLAPPPYLAKDSAKIWEEIAPRLRAARLLTELDTLALAKLCDAEAVYRQATEQMVDGAVIRRADGALVMSAAAMAQAMAFKRVKAMLSEFGMTPVARSRVSVNPQGDLLNGLTQFLNGAPKRA